VMRRMRQQFQDHFFEGVTAPLAFAIQIMEAATAFIEMIDVRTAYPGIKA